ncbi:MAG: ABC transporter permease subunit [Clostridia bacterium]|nr:ABC transporter permease subunit [Clostridia bacterium]
MTKKSNIWRIACIVLVFLFLYMPIGVLILYSFNSGDSTAVFKGFSFRWYKELFTDTATLNALKNTLILAILSSLISTIIGTAAAYGISKMRNKHIKNITMSATQIPMINPEIVTGISMMLLFVFVANILKASSFLGFWTVLIAHITFNLPYVILLVLPKFKEMDKSLPEAAQDLGCTPFKSFFKVELPAIMPGIVAGFIMAFTLSIDDFVISYFTTGSGFETLPIRIYSMTKKRVTPDMYALSTLIFVTILVLLLISNFASGKNKIELSKKAKTALKFVGGGVFGTIAIVTVVILCISAATEVKTVNVYNWGEYISDGGDDSLDVNDEFEKWAEKQYKEKYGKKVRVQVNYTTYASNEDLYAKIANGAGGYDIIVPSDYILEKMHNEDLLQPIDTEKIPNLIYLGEQFDNMFIYDHTTTDENGNKTTAKETYGIAYTYGVVGIVYNSSELFENAPYLLEKIKKDELGWEIMFGVPLRDENGNFVYDSEGKMMLDMVDPENKKINESYLKLSGQILQFNNPRDAFGSAMYYLGIDVNNPKAEDWKALYGLLAMQKEHVQGYVMDEIYNKMEKGEAWVAAYYAGDCLSMMGENSDLDFYYPRSAVGVNDKGEKIYDYRTNIFADAMCIPKTADSNNLELAHWYINFMMEPEIAYANAEYIYYGCPYNYDPVDENGNYVLDDVTRFYNNALTELYKINMGYYEFLYDKDGEILKDDDGNYLLATDDDGNLIVAEKSDFSVIYESSFENDLENMFKVYAFMDLTESYPLDKDGNEIKEKSNLTILNESWEKLKVESASMTGIYVICAVIAVGAIALIVFLQVKKRRQRRYYWGKIPNPKAKAKKETNPDLSETVTVAIAKAEKKDK